MANILVIGPHPDDQEISMGGTIIRLADQGHHVLIVDITDGSPTPHGERETRLPEAQAALKHLQPQSAARGGSVRRILLDLPNRRVEHTLAARHMVAGVIRAHQANILFIPHWEDAHPDHRAVTRIAEDARFDAKLTKVNMPVPPGFDSIGPPIYPKWVFYAYMSHLRRPADPNFCIDITGVIDRKIAAIREYVSQFGSMSSDRHQSLPERIRAAGMYFGSRIGTEFAEPFFTKEPLALGSLDGLMM